MNAKLLEGLVATSFLVAGVGTAHAANFQSASTPEKTPMVTTPFVATPDLATPAIATPSEQAHATVQPIQLPTAVSAELDGLVSRDVTTPEATPAADASPAVPSVGVAAVEVPSAAVDEIPVQIDLPAAATAGTDGAHAWSSSLPWTVDAAQSGNGASIRVGGATANAGMNG